MSQITVPVESESFFSKLWNWLRSVNPIYFVVLALLVGVAYLNPVFFEPNNFLTFLERSAPLMIMTAGQVYVLVSGGFDLSVGSIATYSVIAAAILANNDPGSTWWVLLIMYAAPVKLSVSAGCMASVSVNGCSPAARINQIPNLNVEREEEAPSGFYCPSSEKICNWH